MIFAMLLFFWTTNAQKDCGVNFAAHSGERSLYCKYCDESVKFTIPIKIKFNSTRICDAYNKASGVTAEAKCKFNSLIYYISYLYFKGWYDGNSFADQKCFGLNNPRIKHAAYQGADRELGNKNFSFEDYEVEGYLKFMVDAKKYIDVSSYNDGFRLSAKWALLVIRESCN